MTRVVLLRVGIDSGCGGSQGPLFDDGAFEFMCIPDRDGVSDRTYGDIIGRNGRPHADYFAPRLKNKMAKHGVHHDPEFDTFTYGDPKQLKRRLSTLLPGDFLVFYCGLQRWDSDDGWDDNHHPALYIVGYFNVQWAGMAADLPHGLQKAFVNNFHVRYPDVFAKQRATLVLVKGGKQSSRLLRKAHQISVLAKNKSGMPLKVLSPDIRKIVGDFGGHHSIQRCAPRWIVDEPFVSATIDFVTKLE